MRKKRVLGFLFIFTILFIVSGCGFSTKPETTSSTIHPTQTAFDTQPAPTTDYPPKDGLNTQPDSTPATNESPKSEVNDKVSTLFVGNSFVFTGDVPERIRVLSRMYGIEMEYETICPGGATLSETKSEAMNKMQNEKFDYAVFQDYGTRPLEDEQGFMDDVKELCDEAKKNGAIPVLYNPAWVNQDGKPDKELQDMETEVYEKAADTNEAILVNAGDAWVYVYQKIPDSSLYAPGDYHANNAGACLTACVFASTLFNLHIKDFYEGQYFVEEMVELGQAAWEFVSHYKENGESPTKIITVTPGTNEKVKKY